MSWLRADVDGDLGLEQALVRARESQTPVDPFLAVMDLRWWQSRVLAPESRVRWPKAAEFARRWTWGEKRVRLLLARESEWSDPKVAERWAAYRGRTEDGNGTDAGRKEDGIDEGSTSKNSEPGRTEDGNGTDGGKKKGDTRGVGSPPPPPPPPQKTNTPVALVEDRTEVDPTPKWARGHKGVPAISVQAAIVRALSAIRQKPVDPARCETDAKAVLGLWKASQHPPIDAFVDQVERVARWAREAPDAENDIRGLRPTGERWGPDRSMAVATICRHERWGDRVDAADRWIANPRPSPAKAGKAAHDWTPPPTTGPPVDEAEVDRVAADLQRRAREAAEAKEESIRKTLENRQRRQAVSR